MRNGWLGRGGRGPRIEDDYSSRPMDKEAIGFASIEQRVSFHRRVISCDSLA